MCQCDVDKMLASMSCKQFNEWFNFYNENPWGFEWDNFRHKLEMSMLCNGLFHPKEYRPPSDFDIRDSYNESAEQSSGDFDWKTFKKQMSSVGKP